MNIEHKTHSVEHWIVDGKAYRLATEADVGKDVYRSDLDFKTAIEYNLMTLHRIEASEFGPYIVGCRWKFAYVQDDSLLTPQRVPVPELGDGWYLLTAEDGEIQPGDKIRAGYPGIATWTDLPHEHKWAIATWIGDGHKAARYFGVVEPEAKTAVPEIDWTKPVRTKDGRAVRVLCTDGPGDYSVVGFIEGVMSPECWHTEGRYFESFGADRDLENIPPEPKRIRIERWVNVYKNELCIWDSKANADKWKSNNKNRLACVKIVIDYAEGEGL